MLVVVAAILTIGFVAVPLLLRAVVLEAFKIPAGSMMPTLMVGDHVLVTKSAYGPDGPPRGDAVVFSFPENEKQDFVKRVIGRGGDRIEVKDGRPLVNGRAIPFCSLGRVELPGFEAPQRGELGLEFLDAAAYFVFYEDDRTGEPGAWTVPAGHFFMMGDNRNNSFDSRMWFEGRGGTVARERIRGRAAYVWLARKATGGVDRERSGLSLAEPRLLGLLAEQPQVRERFERCLSEWPRRGR